MQTTASRAYENYFLKDPFHPLLERHQLGDTKGNPENAIAVEMTFGYRAVGFFDPVEQTYVWFWCGSHADYDRQFRRGR